jgi:DNA (cytosine-5)-methyltransferase 1
MELKFDGREFRQRRIALRVSQFKLAKLSQVSSQIISGWERGTSEVSAEVSRDLESAFAELSTQQVDGKGKKKNFKPHKNRRTPPPPVLFAEPRLLPAKSAHSPKVIAAFAGCGGMSEGFFQAGFDLVGHVEINAHARNTYEVNFPGSACLGEDINSVDFSRLATQFPAGTVDVVIGGPPCQGFSLAGKREENDPRNRLFEKLIELADAVQPKFVVMENVRLLTSMRNIDGGLVIDDVLEEFKSRGYEATLHFVNAADYGVAQSRRRIFVVAVKRDQVANRRFEFPTPTHGFNQLGLEQVRTFGDVAGDLERLESGGHSSLDPLHWAVDHPAHIIEMLHDVPEGRSAHENPDPKNRPNSGYNTTYKRIEWNKPGSTISTNFSMISGSRNVHPRQTRSITIREGARVQSFPDDFRFLGPWGEVRTMIGNAVPPLLARVLAASIREWLKKPHLLQPSAVAGKS